MKDAKHILQEALSERTAVNPAYSLRAFARDLGVSPQQLSNVMTGRRGLGPQLAEQVAGKLDLRSRERDVFLESLKAKFSKSKIQRIVSKTRLQVMKSSADTKSLEVDLFKAISNWYHFSLIELIKISKRRNQTAYWFSEKLGIPENEVKLALGRLERLELISKLDAKWVANQDVVTFDKGVLNDAVKNFHRQILEKAILAMSFQNSDERYGSSSTIPVKVKDVPIAKKLIQNFRDDFNKAVTSPEEGEEVYALSLQFFRLTQTTQEK